MSIKPIVLALSVAFGAMAQSFGASATSLTQYGVTWNFSKAVEYGTFVTGDYYVIDPGGGVVITSVTPTPAGGRNGSMVNPLPFPAYGQVKNQGYDNRIAYYNAAAGVSFPHTLKSGDSLVSTVSLTDSDLNSSGSYTASWQSMVKPSPAHVKLKTAAVLTVLGSAPPAGSFRPPFVGPDKPIYTTSQIQGKYLPRLKAPSSAPSKPVSYFERGMERPWLLHGYDWEARLMHPLENMHNYHQNIGEFLSEASMIMVTSLATDTLRNRYIQTGIDTYHTIILGAADSGFFEWQVIYTGLLLGDSKIANAVKSGSKTQGRATEKFYFWSSHTSEIPPSAGVTPGKTWSGATVFFRKQYGVGEHEHLHPSEWGKATAGTDPATGGKKSESYRQANDSIPHMGMFLASRMLGAQSYWRNTANDAYLQRWMTEDWAPFAAIINQYWYGVPNYTKNMGSPFMNEMWTMYNSYTFDGTTPPPSGAPETPAASVPGGVYAGKQNVVLTTGTAGAKIHYTLDGSAPSTSSAAYSAAVPVPATARLRAISVLNGTASAELDVWYVIDSALPILAPNAVWQNLPVGAESGDSPPHENDFTITTVVTPLATGMDGVVGLSENPVDSSGGYSKLATTVRFNTDGLIDARDGGSYRADKSMSYVPGVSYRVEMKVDFTAKTYDVIVNGSTLATGYRFRTGQEGASKLAHLAFHSSIKDKSMAVKNVTPVPSIPGTGPDVGPK